MRFWVLILAALTLPGAIAGAAEEDSGASGPAVRLKPPTFPLEPQKKDVLPVNTASYVQAPTEPPRSEVEKETPLPRSWSDPDRWATSLELGWFYDDVSASHSFTGTGGVFGASGGTTAVKRDNGNPLSLGGRLRLRPPHSFLSAYLDVSGTTGRAEAGGSGSVFAPQRFTVQDVKAEVGPRAHFLPRQGSHDLSLGVGAGYAFSSFTTLAPDLMSLDVDNRQLLTVMERLEYRYLPEANWAVRLSAGYGELLSASGSGDVSGRRYHRLEAEAAATRYLAEGQALGLGLIFASESIDWAQTTPFPLQDSVSSQDFRIQLFWRREF